MKKLLLFATLLTTVSSPAASQSNDDDYSIIVRIPETSVVDGVTRDFEAVFGYLPVKMCAFDDSVSYINRINRKQILAAGECIFSSSIYLSIYKTGNGYAKITALRNVHPGTKFLD